MVFAFLFNSMKTLTGNLDPCKSGEEESETPWKRNAVGIQQTLHSNLKDLQWGYYKDSDEVYLMRNIGFALFGPPDELPDRSNKNTGYSAKKLFAIGKMLLTVKENDSHDRMGRESISIRASSFVSKSNNLKKTPSSTKTAIVNGIGAPKSNLRERGTVMSVVFVVLQVKTKGNEESAVPEPVFRVPNETDGNDCYRYIDRELNVYKGWHEYLKYNNLPIARFCYPADGAYTCDSGKGGKFEFDETPASKVRKVVTIGHQNKLPDGFGDKEFKNGFDDSNAESSVSNSSVLNLNISRKVFIFASTIMLLIDPQSDAKPTNDSNVLVKNVPENPKPIEQDSWKSLSANNLGMIAAGARVASPDYSENTNALTISPKTTNCCGVVILAHYLHGKLKRGELSSEDVAQFSACVLFFTMSAIGEKAAKNVIDEASEGMVNSLRSGPGTRGGKKKAGGRRVGLMSAKDFDFNAGYSGFLLTSWERAQNESTSLCGKESSTTALHEEQNLLKGRDNFTRAIEAQSAFTRECADLNLISLI